jgi:PTS system beta-glucosides-specific IIC component
MKIQMKLREKRIMFNIKEIINKILNKSDDVNKTKYTLPVREDGKKQLPIYSPLKGKILELSKVSDQTFSTGCMGDGIAIIPDEGKLFSPVRGKILSIFPTKHAICIQSEDGMEILIHIGIDTVMLKGNGFKTLVNSGDSVEVGTPLLEFDLNLVSNSGYETTTLVIITNSSEYSEIINSKEENVAVSTLLLTILE